MARDHQAHIRQRCLRPRWTTVCRYDAKFGGSRALLPPPPRVLEPLFHTAGHAVRTQHGVTASAGQKRGDVELRSYFQDAAGRRSLVFDLSMTHDRFGSSSHVKQKGLLSHPQGFLLRIAKQHYATIR